MTFENNVSCVREIMLFVLAKCVLFVWKCFHAAFFWRLN